MRGFLLHFIQFLNTTCSEIPLAETALDILSTGMFSSLNKELLKMPGNQFKEVE